MRTMQQTPHRTVRPGPALVVLVAVFLTAVAGCGGADMAFRQDDRIDLLTPGRDGVALSTPVPVRWNVRDRIKGVAGYVVTVNRSPQPPGELLSWFVRDDDRCEGRGLRTCLSPAELQNRGVFVTKTSDVDLTLLPERRRGSESLRARHDVTLALLDRDGRRIGDVSWTTSFRAPGSGPTSLRFSRSG
jgi:hypothetical protein